MRIGLITGEYPPDQGGVGDFTAELARAVAAGGHSVHVITTEDQVPRTGERGGARCHALGKCKAPVGPGATAEGAPVTVHRKLGGWGWRCWSEIGALADDLALDVLNVQYQAAAYGMHPAINLVPRRSARPAVVVTFHDLKVPYLFPKAGPARWWVVRMLARRAEAVIVTNGEDYQRLEEEGVGGGLHLIPIGSNIAPTVPPGYDRSAERARWGIEPEHFLLGYFGFFNASKGVEELIRALGLLVEEGLPAHLLKVGGRVGSSDPTNREYAAKIEGLIADLGLTDRVHWTGYASPEQVSAALLATDVCVLPFRDGVSFRRGSLLACLAHGRAIVTTQPRFAMKGPLPEARDGENMLLVEPGDATGLARAVRRLMSNRALRARLEEEARALADAFSWERIAQQTLGVFDRVIRNSQ